MKDDSPVVGPDRAHHEPEIFLSKIILFRNFFTMLNFQLFFKGTKFSIKFDKKKTVSQDPVAFFFILENF